MKTKYYRYLLTSVYAEKYRTWFYAQKGGRWYVWYCWESEQRWTQLITSPNVKMEEIKPEELVLNNVSLL